MQNYPNGGEGEESMRFNRMNKALKDIERRCSSVNDGSLLNWESFADKSKRRFGKRKEFLQKSFARKFAGTEKSSNGKKRKIFR